MNRQTSIVLVVLLIFTAGIACEAERPTVASITLVSPASAAPPGAAFLEAMSSTSQTLQFPKGEDRRRGRDDRLRDYFGQPVWVVADELRSGGRTGSARRHITDSERWACIVTSDRSCGPGGKGARFFESGKMCVRDCLTATSPPGLVLRL